MYFQKNQVCKIPPRGGTNVFLARGLLIFHILLTTVCDTIYHDMVSSQFDTQKYMYLWKHYAPAATKSKKGRRSSEGHKVIDLGVIWNSIISWVYMPNMKLLTLTVTANVKVDNRLTDRQTDRTKTICTHHSIRGHKNQNDTYHNTASVSLMEFFKELNYKNNDLGMKYFMILCNFCKLFHRYTCTCMCIIFTE